MYMVYGISRVISWYTSNGQIVIDPIYMIYGQLQLIRGGPLHNSQCSSQPAMVLLYMLYML